MQMIAVFRLQMIHAYDEIYLERARNVMVPCLE